MKIKHIYLLVSLLLFIPIASGQVHVTNKIEQLKQLKIEITTQEKEALKAEVV